MSQIDARWGHPQILVQELKHRGPSTSTTTTNWAGQQQLVNAISKTAAQSWLTQPISCVFLAVDMASATPYQHIPIDPKSGEIRLLVLLPPAADKASQNSSDTPINCRLETSSISTAAGSPYDVLSYTWEDTTDQKQEDILINGLPSHPINHRHSTPPSPAR